MGCCLSKTTPLSNVEPDIIDPPKPQIPPTQLQSKIETEEKEEQQHMLMLEKEEEKGRKSHDKRSELNSESDVLPQSTNSPPPQGIAIATNVIAMAANGTPVRTSSCTKEEVDAILIQCGRLSRSNSGKCSGSARKYSGSKRSHDLDKENTINNSNVSVEVNCDDDGDERMRRRQSRGSQRRTTPSRSRERDPHLHLQRSGRRVSRSPGRRSESPNTANSNGSTTNTTAGSSRPGKKMVSVPATIINNVGEVGSVKRVLVKRNVTPPRSRSPARSALVKNQPSPISRKAENSPNRRKTEHSPYRRTPLTDLDMNSLPFQPLTSIKGQPLSSTTQKKLGVEANDSSSRGVHRRARSRGGEGSEQSKAATGHDEIADQVEVSGSNTVNAANYNSLLLQDIQSFHQKVSVSKLPQCVSKACSIVEAVADLNLSSSSTRPVVELMEPSLHKFVAVSGGIDGEFDEQESIGSNSFVTVTGNSWDEGVSLHRLAAVSQPTSSHTSGRGVAPRSRTATVGR